MKKLLSIIMSICIIASFSTSIYAVGYGEELQNAPTKTYEQKFLDVPENHWAFEYISEMAERGVVSGYPDGRFYPDSQITRAEFAKIMTTAAGLSIAEPTMQIFADVKITDWYAPYVHAAKGYLSAYTQNGSSYYLPNTPALREDIAVALVKLKGYSTTGADMTALQRMFSDYQSISENAKIYVTTAIENGLISGYDDGTFKGQNSITRAEAATLLWRAYQYGNANKTYGNTSSIS
ncbi:MAG: S-layer homology domain-containing protein, partial [Clostridia bacterium]